MYSFSNFRGNMKGNYVNLIVAGYDPCGCAGLLMDLKVHQSLGVLAAAVPTVFTVQNTCGVLKSIPIDEKYFISSLKALKEDIKVAYIKVGMLGKIRFLWIIKDFFPDIPMILDPIIFSKNRFPLIDNPFLILQEEIFLLTPNYEEALNLAKNKESDPIKLLITLKKNSKAENILLKGGHLSDKFYAVDFLLISHQSSLKKSLNNLNFQEISVEKRFQNKEFSIYALRSPRIKGKHPRGTGCALSSAIASYLNKGEDLFNAVLKAKKFLLKAIKNATKIGKCYEILKF
jgi:hydroxymethylpyrimidine/phosphomethylpyrimidine kinase